MTRRSALLLSLGRPLVGQRLAPAVASVRWTPHPVFNGAPILFRSKTYSGPASWLDRKIEFRPDVGGYSALAGVSLDQPPGRCPLAFGTESVEVPVMARTYRTSVITVAPKFVEPPKESEARIAEESALKKRVFHASPAERLWKGPFTAPAAVGYTSSFGVRRTYNGKTQSVHQGLDYAAGPGTEIKASNSGRVVIARDMYFEGGLVMLDHGESIFTLYMHLSEFLVQEGQFVEKGSRIARSGATGRVTGPHLHFAVQWQGSYVEPSTFLRLWQA